MSNTTYVYGKDFPAETVVFHKASGLLAVLKTGYSCQTGDPTCPITYAAYLEEEPSDAQKALFTFKTINRHARLTPEEFTIL